MPRRFLDQRSKLPLLRVAEALDAHGSLLKASATPGLGQPALTRSPRELEAITGAALFERQARGVRPTAAGVEVIRAPRRVLGESRRMGAELDALGAVEGGSIAVGALLVAAVGHPSGNADRVARRVSGAAREPAPGAHRGPTAAARVARTRSVGGPPLRTGTPSRSTARWNGTKRRRGCARPKRTKRGGCPDAASTCAGSTVSIASPRTRDGGALRDERLVPAPMRDA